MYSQGGSVINEINEWDRGSGDGAQGRQVTEQGVRAISLETLSKIGNGARERNTDVVILDCDLRGAVMKLFSQCFPCRVSGSWQARLLGTVRIGCLDFLVEMWACIQSPRVVVLFEKVLVFG
jgi:hypothetical protein